MINDLFKKLSEQTPLIVDIKRIKIPKHFTRPGKKKLEERRQYLKENKRFKTPIVVDKSLNLVDGYTSYFLAKEQNVKEVEVKVVSENETI